MNFNRELKLSPSSKKRRVLLIAEAANPEWSSVPLVGWKLVRALSEVVDVHFVTHVRNRSAILRQGLTEGAEFTAIDNEAVTGLFSQLAVRLGGAKGKGWTTRTAFSSLAYYSFEREVWRQFSSRLESGEFDLVHRITPLSPTSPSIIARRLNKIGVPFVLGPLNGGIPWPKNFRDVQYAEREWLSHLRWLYRVLPGYRSTRTHSSAILAGSQFTLGEMPASVRSKCVFIPENAVDLELVSQKIDEPRSPLAIGFVGRLVPYKGADVLIEAASSLIKAGALTLHIIGDGPQRQLLEELAQRLGVSNRISFYGWLPHSEVQTLLSTCDFLALPSVREFGGGVVVEAMAKGIPPIVADYGGPSELVDDSTGIKVPFMDRSSLVSGFEQALAKVLAKPRLRKELGEAAQRKVVEALTWAAKADQIKEVYEAVLAKRDLSGLGYLSRLSN